MPVTIIRPDSTILQAGWDSSTIHLVIGDSDNSTSAIQDNEICNWRGTLSNITIGGDITIQEIELAIHAVATRAVSTTIAATIEHPTALDYPTQVLSFTNEASIRTGDVFNKTGSGATITREYIDELIVQLVPAAAGVTIFEAWLNVTYTAASTTTGLTLTTGKIILSQGKITI